MVPYAVFYTSNFSFNDDLKYQVHVVRFVLFDDFSKVTPNRKPKMEPHSNIEFIQSRLDSAPETYALALNYLLFGRLLVSLTCHDNIFFIPNAHS